MEIEFTQKAEIQLQYWKRSGNEAILKKIRSLISSILETPFDGIGKPEPLKHELSGYWSRRITDEHRLVYEIQSDKVIIIQCRFHYTK
ncbi:Txe/YoeB family addiction module toxin [Dyadobacter chenwenxiniae]|uniref:Putative mRNA interferase YoeB n=1 Tax=Dyadobacter chenwenxiniae TaxID=2906456 RepID=A0A9X1PJE7_9BACT|nr:Txe/YoeB family addiction module toxin [Dyadobacter chenwenxiniae]MCF0061460.1 Txe/YoeB family addiction module toxin [Dyadobacter chenwenxiniae]UON81283.1 Txe/YoeB family addiction module toxin [Dyadobacter chenwenxiniae]